MSPICAILAPIAHIDINQHKVQSKAVNGDKLHYQFFLML